MKFLYILLLTPFFNSCSTLLTRRIVEPSNSLIKVESKIILTNKEKFKIPSVVTKSGEKESIVVDPHFSNYNNGIYGYKLFLKPSFRKQSLRTKGVFTIYHYNEGKAPRQQRTKFNFISKSGETVNIPIQIGYYRRNKMTMVGCGKDGNDFYREYYFDTKPQKATLQLSASIIDSTGQPMENKAELSNPLPPRSRDL